MIISIRQARVKDRGTDKRDCRGSKSPVVKLAGSWLREQGLRLGNNEGCCDAVEFLVRRDIIDDGVDANDLTLPSASEWSLLRGEKEGATRIASAPCDNWNGFRFLTADLRFCQRTVPFIIVRLQHRIVHHQRSVPVTVSLKTLNIVSV